MKSKKILVFAGLLFSIIVKANNVMLQNISVINNAAGTGKIIEFDVSWENSWRVASTGNWDGVWVFFKFKDNEGKWYPLYFTGIDVAMPAGAVYDMGNNSSITGVGMFIFRSALGSGTTTFNNVRAGIQSYPGTFEVRGFAIEMVYIPSGSFYVGDGGALDAYQNGNAVNTPYQITGNGSTLTMGTSTGQLHDILNTTGFTGTITGFPTGYNAFWLMKYEVSQGAYRDFLNTLTYDQQENRFWINAPPNSAAGTAMVNVADPAVYLEIATPGSPSGNGTPAVVGCDADADNIYNEPADGEWKPVTGLNWGDAAAYLDWAGLRPMTELEFEKACRGPLNALANEYAWGTTDISTTAYTFSNLNLTNETITNASSVLGNAVYTYTVTDKIVRAGIFATAVSTRESSGAGYYGAMELSGNLHEYCVTTANAAGRSFNGKHGDGILTSIGNANENQWPGINGSTNAGVASGVYDGGDGVRATTGIFRRGGAYNTSALYLETSARHSSYITAMLIVNSSKLRNEGIRGVRDAN